MFKIQKELGSVTWVMKLSTLQCRVETRRMGGGLNLLPYEFGGSFQRRLGLQAISAAFIQL